MKRGNSSAIRGGTADRGWWKRAAWTWVVIALTETLHGILRIRFLVPIAGEDRSRQLGVFTGSALILCIAWLSLPWIGVRSRVQLLRTGALWLGLMLGFEAGLGRFVFHTPWPEILRDYDVRRGGLLGFGMLVLALSPLLAARWRGMRG